MKNEIILTVRMDRAFNNKMECEAKRLGLKKSDIVRRALHSFMENIDQNYLNYERKRILSAKRTKK